MVNINIYRKLTGKHVANLNITDRINLVVGDSGTGKSHICDMINPRGNAIFKHEAHTHKGVPVRVVYCEYIDTLKTMIQDKEYDMSVIIMDEYLATEVNKPENIKIKNMLDGARRYFVIFQRDNIIKYNVGINSLFKVVRHQGIYRFEKYIHLNEIVNIGNITGCTHIITEDSKSGYIILSRYFQDDTDMVVAGSDGNGDFDKKLIEYNGHSIICALDYDKGGWQICNILDKIRAGQIQKNKIKFIRMESFEEIIANSRLISDIKPEILELANNIDKNMNCSYRHRGEYFSALIIKYFNDGAHCKYTKNNISCFIKECKDCNNVNCKFRNNTEEKCKLTFSGKYGILYQLYKIKYKL